MVSVRGFEAHQRVVAAVLKCSTHCQPVTIEIGKQGNQIAALMRGSRIGPPADRLYAVDPVGVATISPSLV